MCVCGSGAESVISAGGSSNASEAHNTAEDTVTPINQPTATATATTTAAEADIDFIDAEQLVASLFGDDDSSISFEQPPQPTDNKKGFVTADHEDAARWFYQDPQGVIQGEMASVCLSYLFTLFGL